MIPAMHTLISHRDETPRHQMWKERARSRYRRFALGAETSTEYSHEHAPSRQNFGSAAAVNSARDCSGYGRFRILIA